MSHLTHPYVMSNGEAAKLVVKHLIDHGMHHCCLNCKHFNKPRNICYKFNVAPPAEVIVYSCGKDWEDTIPF